MHHKKGKEETREGYGCYCDEDGKCYCTDHGVCYCCSPQGAMSKEEAEANLTQVATDIWMEFFVEACRKEWKKQSKSINKLAAQHVKKAKAEWDKQMK